MMNPNRGGFTRIQDGGSMTLKRDENDKEYIYKLPVHGYPQNCLNVEIDGNVVRLRGERQCKEENQQSGTTRKWASSFDYSFSLPDDAKPADISSNLDPKSNVLSVRVGREAKKPETEVKAISIPIQRSPKPAPGDSK
ncbi:hypothetical protein AAMO2058_000408500 [Amorphochlora amoebiformis]